ncbi:polysialyltransferase family glycosyltransferase [Streptomyces sp. NPDC049906]|uniref:polysialyltransferase family glycosyltransferase n=1 Tax=Streptomyces sp. NPDC049906 TaxID=3155656 RepID=UPI00341D3F63
MTVRVLLASTAYGVATLAAALDAGLLPAADRTVLLLSRNAAVPETAPPLDASPGFARLASRFDEVRSWNATVAPFHPSAWSPRTQDVPLWERSLRLAWDLGDEEVALVVESLHVNPAMAIARIFPDAPLHVYADGLMSYGPTRDRLDVLIGTRVRELLHLDLVPGLRPLLLTEFGVPARPVPTDAFGKVLDELADATGDVDLPPADRGADGPGPALLLGQYLAELGILTPDEEEDLHLRMLHGALARGHRRFTFKPHPTAPARQSARLARAASEAGAELTVLDRPVLAEVLYRRRPPGLVVGCFSTALFTAATFHGLPVARVGTELLLERLTPYQNGNRVPVTLVDALVPDLAAAPDGAGSGTAVDAAALVTAVGFAMQPRVLADRRPEAVEYLARHLDEHTRRYFKKRRLTALGLPGGVPRQFAFLPRNAAVRRVARGARAVKRAALG